MGCRSKKQREDVVELQVMTRDHVPIAWKMDIETFCDIFERFWEISDIVSSNHWKIFENELFADPHSLLVPKFLASIQIG